MPLCVGHEIVGTAIRVGPKTTLVSIGQRVGVGAQVYACLDCKNCKGDNENYCPNQVGEAALHVRWSETFLLMTTDTYNAAYPDGYISQGGYASHVRVHEYFVFKIPDSIPTSLAAPMLCAGITTYSPLVRAGIGPGKKVAVIGM